MSKILITGNGFDLFHHLPTKYHHFISIMETIEKYEFSKDLDFDNLFGKHFKDKYPVDYSTIVNNYNVVNFKFSHEKIKLISELLEANLWYKHFKNVTEIDTWIDFEMEIENVLKQFEIFNKFRDKGSVKKNLFSDPLIKYTDFQMFEVVSLINNLGAFKIHEKYINKRNSSINIKIILEDLVKSFEDFIIIFNRYLVDILSVFYNNIKEKLEIPFHLMNEIYTFNYTPTFENIYNVDKSKVVYLHGEINEDCEKQNLVLGVSEISDEIKEFKAYDFTKYYQKIKKHTNKKFVDISIENKAYDEETFFYIVGHSLDISDKEYILALFRFLEQDALNKSKICVFYYDDNDRDSKIRNLLSIEKEEVVSRMHRENRLCFVQLNNNNLDIEFNKKLYNHNVFI